MSKQRNAYKLRVIFDFFSGCAKNVLYKIQNNVTEILYTILFMLDVFFLLCAPSVKYHRQNLEYFLSCSTLSYTNFTKTKFAVFYIIIATP